MKKLSTLFSIVMGCCVFAVAGGAPCQTNQLDTTSDSDDTSQSDERAKEEFQKGIALFESGKFVDAADSFRAAMAEKSSWKMYYNIGQSEAAAQRYGLALEAFESYLVSGGDDVPFAKKDEVLAEIERMRLLVGVVELKAPQRSELVIDGYVRGTVPIEGVIRVAAGPHHMQVKREGEILFDAQVRIAGGMTTPIDLLSADGGDAISPTEGADADSGADTVSDTHPVNATSATGNPAPYGMPKMLLAGIITGGAGILFAGVGAAFLIKGTRDSRRAEDLNSVTEKDKIDDYNDRVLPINKTMTIVGLSVGGAAIAAGTVLVILGLKQKKNGQTHIQPSMGGLAVTF